MSKPRATAWALVHRDVVMALAFSREEAERLRGEAMKRLAPGVTLEIEPLYRRVDIATAPPSRKPGP